ncbi:MAG: ABC-F family ATP-binding cassette domain-containing protein [Acidimicrobiia bacterium]|nr:ABC-F family ATP-binding cassette domain-containing protein [Acidimicrobiia bacterium]
MHLLSLEGISISYPEQPVLEEVSMGISAGDHIGVIGRNGSGKTTLLAIIAGTEQADAGSIVRARGLQIARLDQNPVFQENATVGEIIGEERTAIAMADRFGLTDLDAICSTLSGGQRKRLALAVALSVECDLLILDEPTNHLDVDLIDWLEDHLRDRREALMLVTHDRFLLDRVATRVIEVHDRTLYSHQGTYKDYLEASAKRRVLEATAEHRLQQRIKTELAWLRRSPKARTTKSRARVSRAQDLMARQAGGVGQELTIELPARRIGSKVVNLHSAGKRYGDVWVLRHVEFKLQADARVGIVGPNAAGKTTLLRLISGLIEPDEGTVTMGSTVHPGWYGQDPRPIPPQMRLYAAVREHLDEVLLESGIRVSGAQLLERFQFTRDQQQSEVGDLSGGERRRLELLLTLMEAPNLLLLDEPTNDLDIETLTILEEYLDAWNGALVVASHDRYFLERTCLNIFSIETDGSVLHHPGGWVAYRDATMARPADTSRPGGSANRRPQQSRKLSYRDQRELTQLTMMIPTLESRRDELTAALDDAVGDHERFADLSRRLSVALDDVDRAETRWLELSELAERLAQE